MPCLRGGLDDHSVSCHESGRNLADSQVDRVVEGRNAQHHAQRHLCVKAQQLSISARHQSNAETAAQEMGRQQHSLRRTLEAMHSFERS